MDIETGEMFTTLQEIKTAYCFECEKHSYLKTNKKDPDGNIQVMDLETGAIQPMPPDTVVTLLKRL